MAKVVEVDSKSQLISEVFPVWKIVFVGAALGAAYWCITALLGRYTSSLSNASDIATVIVATLGVTVLVGMRVVQPLIVALASGASLWGLAQLTDGLGTTEAILWSVLLYCLAYILFTWVVRYVRVVPVLVVMTLIIIIVRMIINL
jgi:hypothetical protein